MRKKLTICGFVIVIILITLITAVSASNAESLAAYVTQFRVFVNGEERNFENPIVTINDRTYIPLREISEVLGMDVEWDEENRKIIINNSQLLASHDNNSEWGTLYRFKLNGLWGFADVNGNIIVEPQYYGVHDFSEGLAYVIGTEDRPDQTGFIDLTGTLVIPRSSAQVGRFSEGLVHVSVHEWVWGSGGAIRPFIFINREGQDVFGQEFRSVRNFKEGFARVVLPGENINMIFINHEGENIFDMEFKEARDFEGGYAMVILLDGTRTHVDSFGNIVDKGGW